MRHLVLFLFFTGYLSAQSVVDATAAAKIADSLIQVSRSFSTVRNVEKALEAGQTAVQFSLEHLGQESATYGQACYNLGKVFYQKGDYPAAESQFITAKNIQEKMPDPASADYARCLNSLGVLYRDKADYAKAEPLYLKAIEIRAAILGKEHPEYAESLNNLGLLYSDKADFAKAESLFLEAREIWAKTVGKQHPDYARPTNNLAIIYHSKGDYARAEPLYLEAIGIWSKNGGKTNPDYAMPLLNLAVLYMDNKEYAKAETMFRDAIDIFANTLGKEHPKYARSLNALAYLYRIKGDHSKAEPLLLEAKDIQARVLGREHPQYARSVETLATLYYFEGQYVKAEPLFQEVKDVWAKILGKEHVNYSESLLNLAKLYQQTGRDGAAAALFLEINNLVLRRIEKTAAYSSESQMLAFLRTIDDKIAGVQSFSQTHPNNDFSRIDYDNALFLNGFLLENARRLARSVNGADSLTRQTYERWQGCLRKLASEYTKPVSARREVDELEAEAETCEKSLTRQLPAFRETRHAPHWRELRDLLPAGSAAVEFIHYPYFNPNSTDSTMYAALVLQPGWEAPKRVNLFEEQELAALLQQKGEPNEVYINHLYGAQGSKNSLYQMIWQPLETSLSGINTIYFTPSGLLHRLNMSAIPVQGDVTLSDHYNLVELGSTRQLIARAAPKQGPETNRDRNAAALFGGIAYDMDSIAILQANAGLSNDALSNVSRGLLRFDDADSLLRGGAWKYLPGAEKEINAVEKVLKTAGIEVQTSRDYSATEDAFKLIGQQKSSPRVLHIATHGFFFPDPETSNKKSLEGKEPAFKVSDHPMIRSGLILAGGNYAWQNGKPLRPGMDDGILTAYEISQMNLSHTELVVLSACETGLGDIQGSEGVYGLQRAFKIAGARYLIMSLWQVPDQQTGELMQAFYKKWLLEKLEIPRAFREAQQELKARYPGNPFVWAGFVLME